MSTSKKSLSNTHTSIDSEFIGYINSLNDAIKEFYGVAKYNVKEASSFLSLFDPQLSSMESFLKWFAFKDKDENIAKIMENINQCKNIVNQLKNNSNLNLNNLNLFFGDAKILFNKMRTHRSRNLRTIKHSMTSKIYSNNKNKNIDFNTLSDCSTNVNDLVNKKYFDKNDYNKLINLIGQLKIYDEIVEKFSNKAKDNFVNLRKMILNILLKGEANLMDKNFNINKDFRRKSEKIDMNLLEIKTKYENEISRLNIKIKDLEKNYENIELISSKATKFDELKQKLELELIDDNNAKFNLLNDNDFEERIINLININKKLNIESKKLKNDINNLGSNNIALKQKLLVNDIDLKNSLNIEEIESLNKKNEELSKILTSKMEQIISLEKENINLKSLLSESSTNNSNMNQNIPLSDKRVNNLNNIKTNDYKKLLLDNAKYRNSIQKLNKENQDLKMKFQNIFANNNYILSMQQELNQLRKIIEENNMNTDNKNLEYEQKINNLENILNEKEALLNQYEAYENNKDINILIEEMENKDKIISELNNKIANYEKNILLLNQKQNNNNINKKDLNLKFSELEKENKFYKNKLGEMQEQFNKMRKSIESNNSKNKSDKKDEKELAIIKYENQNLKFNINQLNQEISKLKIFNEQNKKENDNLKQVNQELISQNSLINQKNLELLQKINSVQNPNLINEEDLPEQIKKKQEEIDGLNTFIQKLTNECEKSREDIENYKTKINSLQKENASVKNQLERLAKEMPKELNALKSQLDDANKKLSQANINNSNNKITSTNNKSKSNNKEKTNKTFDDGMQEKNENILSKLNKEISELKNKNKELLFKLEDREVKSQNSRYRTEDVNLSGYEEEFDLRKMATGARDKNRSEDINIDYPGIQNYKEKVKEYQFRLDNLGEQVKILLSKIKVTNNIKPTFVQICQLLGYDSNIIEKMTSSEKEKKKILGGLIVG